MAVYELTDGGDLPTTMAGASAGDTILLATGTYAGDVTLVPGVVLAAAYGASPTCTGAFTSGTTTTYTLVRGLRLTADSHNLQTGRARFEDCTFAAAGGVLSLLGDDAGRFEFFACTLGPAVYADLLGAMHVFAGCYLGPDATFVDSPNSDCSYAHCTFVNTTNSYASNVLLSTDKLNLRNCIVKCPTQGLSEIVSATSSGTAQYLVHDCASSPVVAGAATASNVRLVTDVKLRSTGRLAYDSPARNFSTGSGLATFPYGRNRLAVGPDAGCYGYYGDTSAFCASWTLTDPAYGLNLTDVSRGAMLVTANPQTFRDVRDMGSYIAQEVSRFFGNVGFTWGITADGALELRKPFFDATGSVTTNNHAAAIFGIVSDTGVSTITLGVDPRLLFTDLVWEAPTAPFIPARVERFTYGQADGAGLPANSERRYCAFRAHTRTADTTLTRSVFNRWFSGAEVRVYRRWDEDTQWSTTNDEGYDDLVPMSVDNGEYTWYTPNLTTYELNIAGIAKERGL